MDGHKLFFYEAAVLLSQILPVIGGLQDALSVACARLFWRSFASNDSWGQGVHRGEVP